MDEKVIPEGEYCYDENGNCPYFSHEEVGRAKITFCKFLNKGCIGNVSDEEFDYFKYFHNTSKDEDIWELYPLDLLWDQVKECGINNYWEAEDE